MLDGHEKKGIVIQEQNNKNRPQEAMFRMNNCLSNYYEIKYLNLTIGEVQGEKQLNEFMVDNTNDHSTLFYYS